MKKVMTIATAIIMLIGGIFLPYKVSAAEDYNGRSWEVAARSQGNVSSYAYFQLYASPDEEYEWSVTDITPGSYSYVELKATNGNIGSDIKRLSAIATKRFKLYGNVTSSNTSYLMIRIDLTYETYPTYYAGRVDIIK